MVSVLTREAISLEIPIFNRTTGVRLLVAPGEKRAATFALALTSWRIGLRRYSSTGS